VLKDIGPLQIEETYTGKDVLGKDIEIQKGQEGFMFGSIALIFACFYAFLGLWNGGPDGDFLYCSSFLVVVGILLLAFGGKRHEVEVTRYGHIDIKRIKYYFIDGKYKHWEFDKEYETEYLNLLETQQKNPVLLGTRSDSNIKYWLYQDKIWKENEEYHTNEVKLLVGEKLEKKKIRLERAEKAKERRENPEIKEEDGRNRRISQDVKDRVWNRDDGKCVQCGSNEDLEFDHIIPFSKGGANTYRNIQLLCEHCNRSKSAKLG
jgi:5-methylcytosine-specific restriction endonuclease McrA